MSGLDQVNQTNQMGQADRDPMTRRSEQAGYVSQINELSMESELGK